MKLIIVSDDRAEGARLAEALRQAHDIIQVARSVGEVEDPIPAGAGFVLLHRSPIGLRLFVATVRKRFGLSHPVVIGFDRNVVSELPHVLAAGVDDFVAWPKEAEFVATRLALLERRLAGGAAPVAPSAGEVAPAAPPPPEPEPEPEPEPPLPATEGACRVALRAVLSAIQDTVVWLTGAGEFRDFHGSQGGGLGAPPQTVIGHNVSDVFPPTVARRFREAVAGAMAGGGRREVAYELPQEGGSAARFVATFARAGAGEVLAVIRAKDMLPAGEPGPNDLGATPHFLGRVAIAVSAGLFVFSLETERFVWLNQPLGTALGLSVPETMELPLSRLRNVIHPDDRPALVDTVDDWDAVGDDTVIERQFRMRSADGTWRWIVSREAVFRRDASGRAREIIATLVDVHERRGAEERSAALEEQLRLALDGRDEVAYEWEPAGGAMIFLGTSEGARLPATRDGWEARIHPDDVADVRAAARRHLDDAVPFSESYRVRWADGGWRSCLDRGVALRDEAGRPTRWIGVIGDVDHGASAARIGSEEKLQAVAHLAGGLAEDFNKLLLAVFSHVDIALSKLPPGDVREDLLDARHAAEQAANLTRQLLAFGRRQSLQPEYISINDVIGDTIDGLARRLGAHIELSFESSEHLGTVLADPLQIEQILVTLTGRARETMPHGGRVALSTTNVRARDERIRLPGRSRDARYVKLRIEDSGTGIPPELIDHVFDPFFTTGDRPLRPGLDMAMVYGIVDQHEGAITAENLANGGAAFTIYFPVVERPPARLRRPQAPTRGGDETILLVDDDELVRNLAERILKSGGYRVVSARDGVDAVRVLKELRDEISLVVLDMIMPRMGGREAYARMREVGTGARYLFVSGYTMTAQDTDFVQHRGRRFLPKPFNSGQLLREVRAALDQPAPG